MARLLFFNILILLSVSILPKTSYASEKIFCNNAVPGVSKLTFSVDYSRLDLFPFDKGIIGGLKRPIFKKTCDSKSTRILHNRDSTTDKYLLPDQVSSVVSTAGGSKLTSMRLYKSYESVKKNMEIAVGVSGTIASFGFSLSTSYKNIQDSITKSNKKVIDIRTKQYSHAIYMKDARNNDFLTDEFRKALNDLRGKTYARDRYEYKQFIEEHGTHYFKWGSFGGMIRQNIAIQSSYTYGKTDEQLAIQAKASYNGLMNSVSASAEFKIGMTKVDSKFKASTDERVRYYGGRTNLMSKNGLKDWQKSVDKDPALLKAGIKPLYELATEPVKSQLKIAIDQHIFRNYLEELRRKITNAAEKYQDPVIDELFKELKKLQGADMLDVDRVKALNKNIVYHTEQPSWFTENTQVCLKYRADKAEHARCNDRKNTASYSLCSNPGGFTDRYHDNTYGFVFFEGYISGCRLQWGIKSFLADDWFKQILICLKWEIINWSTKTHGVYCARIGSFTHEFHDYSYLSFRINKYQWMLTIPDGITPPLWYRYSRFCLEWEGHDNQCRAAQRKVCAVPGQYTSVYTDSTYRHSKGCYLKWGWFTNIRD